MDMITEYSKKKIIKSLQKAKYRYMKTPETSLKENYGIYIHVPFCVKKCTFCPFYKEIFREERKNEYIEALLNEIRQKDISGKPSWIYFGGGTPNVLSIEDLKKIIFTLNEKIEISEIGIEVLPALINSEYISELKKIGFTRISFGIQSLHENILKTNNRLYSNPDMIYKLVETAKKLDFWVNIDVIVGLPGQSIETFYDDIKQIIKFQPSQIATYPYLFFQNVTAVSDMSVKKQFELMEEAGKLLNDYKRKCIWIFSKEDKISDLARDELIYDYVGFGPGACSTYGSWKIVNPELDIYLNNYRNNLNYSLVAPKNNKSNDWRKFARMINDLKCYADKKNYPVYLNLFISFLKLSGYSKNNLLTRKGLFFAHEITKTLVESLPSPLRNTSFIENYSEYKNAAKNPF